MSPKKIKLLMTLAGQAAAVVGLRSKLRDARKENDKLALADVLVSALGVVTGTALAVRALRRGEEDR